MKNHRGFPSFAIVGAGCLLCAGFLSFAGEPPQAFASPAAPVTASIPSPEPLASPVPESGEPPVQAVPAALPVATPPIVSENHPPVPPQVSGTSPIPFNAQNKVIARTIYDLLKDIQESEFDPEKNLAAISKLQEAIVQTDFARVPLFRDYIKDSLSLNTIRSKDIKTQRANTGKVNKEDSNKTGGKAGGGPFLLSLGGELERSNSRKNEDQISTDISISSQNDVVALDKTRQQQATSYGLLLNELKRLGFSRPIDTKWLYGKWKWRCAEDSATYLFEFKQDGTVYVRLKPDNPNWLGQMFPNKGRGEWKLDYRSLTITMNDANLAAFWKQHALIFFTNKEILSIDEEKMLIASDEDNELKKIVEPSKK